MNAASPVSVSVASLISNAPFPVFMVGAESAPMNDPVPKVKRLPLLSTVSWFSGPTERRLLGVVLPMPTFAPRRLISLVAALSKTIRAFVLPMPKKPVSAKYKEEPGTVLVKADPERMLPTAVMASDAAVPIEESRSSRTSCTVVLSLFVNSSKAPISRHQ